MNESDAQYINKRQSLQLCSRLLATPNINPTTRSTPHTVLTLRLHHSYIKFSC